MRMSRITSGSTKAATRLSSSLCSSNRAKTYMMISVIVFFFLSINNKRIGKALTNEIQAAPRRILTRSSSNCSKISFHSGLDSSAGSSIDRRKNCLFYDNENQIKTIFITIRSISFKITFNTFFRETFCLFNVIKGGDIFFCFSPRIIDGYIGYGRTMSRTWPMHGDLEEKRVQE